MKLSLVICILLYSWVALARPSQSDTEEDEGTEILRMVEVLGVELQGVATQEDSWLSRYQQVAEMMRGNSELTDELLSISRRVMPVIWNVFMGNVMMHTLKQIAKGGVASYGYSTKGAVPPPPPKFLFVYPSELTVDDSFTVQAVVSTRAEANVGFCLFFAPEDGEEVDFDNGDIFFASHVRWHFDYGNSREIAFNDRYNGMWSRPEVTVGGDQWPDLQVGERYLISVMKTGPCFSIWIFLGREMHANEPYTYPGATFCPQQPRTGDPRKLWLTVNEDKTGAGDVILHWVTWFRND